MTKRRRSFGRASWYEPDHLLNALVIFFVIFGLVMLSSASSVIAYKQFGSSYALVTHQLLYGVLPGLILFFIASKIDYHKYKRFAPLFLFIIFGLLIAVLIPGVGRVLGGARRWISVGNFFVFQPAELVKLLLIIFLAAWFTKRREEIRKIKQTLIPFVVLLVSIGVLIMAQPDFGTMLIIVIISMVMYFIAGAPYKHFGILVLLCLVSALFMIQVAPYRLARITAFLNPSLDPQGIGYHIQQASLAVGSGGWLGLGLGHSRQKFAYLPEVHSDSIFAIIAEELGFVVTIVFIALFLLFITRIIKIARRAPDSFGYFIASGIAAWLGFQAFINMGTMVQLLPLTGLPLPFISYGGTAMAVSLTALGVVLNISRQTRLK